MHKMSNTALKSDDVLTQQIIAKGIITWEQLIEYTKQLPYGRNTNRTDLRLVFTEQKGTCSSKHAFLKKVASLNNIPNVKLILAIYKMSEANTKGIGSSLTENNIKYIPEAHCYLKINGAATDITTRSSDFEKIKSSILSEEEIEPEQVAEYKITFHKNYLKEWLEKNTLPFSLDELWSIRETCIQNLSS